MSKNYTKMFTLGIHISILLFCLHQTSEQTPEPFFQTTNSKQMKTKESPSSRYMRSSQEDHWLVRHRKNMFTVNADNNIQKQVQNLADGQKSWLATHVNIEPQDQNHLHAEGVKQAQTPKLTTTQDGTPDVKTTKALTPEVISTKAISHAMTPERKTRQTVVSELKGNQATTPEYKHNQAMAPELNGNKAMTLEVEGNEAVTPNLKSNQAVTPDLKSNQAVTPDLKSNQVVTPDLKSNQAVTLRLKTNQAMTSILEGNQAVNSDLITTQSMNSELVTSRAVTPEHEATPDIISESDVTQQKETRDVNFEFTETSEINISKEIPYKHRATEVRSYELNAKSSGTVNLKQRQDTRSELKPPQDITVEQNKSQQVTIKPQATTQKVTSKPKQIQEQKLPSTRISAKYMPNENSMHIHEKKQGAAEYIKGKQIRNTTLERTLGSSKTSFLELNRSQLLLFESNQEKKLSEYSGCRILNEDGYITLICHHLNLTYIPKSVSKIDSIIFEYNNIQNVTIETFSNISKPNILKGLSLNYNNICNISSNALNRFENLVYLHLSGNPFYYNNLKSLLGAVSKLNRLRHLRMDDIHTITIQYDLFSLMTGTRIDVLILQLYNLGSFSLDAFRLFSNLRNLALTQNKITDVTLHKFSHLEKLYIDKNQLKTIPEFCYTSGNKSMSYLPRLFLLCLKNNMIYEVKNDSFKCLSSLKVLQLEINSLHLIPNDFLGNMPKLYSLDMRNQFGRFITIEPYAFRSKALSILKIGFNADALSIFSSLNDTFKSAPNITVLKIDYISMSHLTNENFRHFFGPLTHLVFLRCFACKITLDPKFILANKPQLKNLDLGSNLIQTLSKETFAHNKKLKILKMRFNKIGHLQESALPKELLNNLETLDLSKNPFTCDCNLQWLIDWLKSSMGKNVTTNYPDNYTCSNPADKANMKLSEVNFSYRECHPWSPGIWVAVVVCPCIVVIAITSLVVYRNRWNIKHYIYLLRKRQNYQLIHGHNYEYDAFVGYEAHDSVWVRRNLLPVLEGEEGLKLCIHERDFLAGIFINDNIVGNMERSKKVILILTNQFARSEWCMFELKVAHSRLIEDGTDVVVILLEKIDARNINNSMRLLFQTTTYIEWTEDLVGRELFWNKLKDAVKK